MPDSGGSHVNPSWASVGIGCEGSRICSKCTSGPKATHVALGERSDNSGGVLHSVVNGGPNSVVIIINSRQQVRGDPSTSGGYVSDEWNKFNRNFIDAVLIEEVSEFGVRRQRGESEIRSTKRISESGGRNSAVVIFTGKDVNLRLYGTTKGSRLTELAGSAGPLSSRPNGRACFTWHETELNS
jgi:hypothetical protein